MRRSKLTSAGWSHRQTMLNYCLQTVTSSLATKRPIKQAGGDERQAATPGLGHRSGMGLKEEEAVVRSSL